LISSKEEVHFKGRYVTLTTEEKDGYILERVHSRNGVTVIVELKPGVLRFAYGTNWKYPTPTPLVVSGYLEDGEDPLECAKREVAEELGVTASDWTHYMTSHWKGTVLKVQEFFLARNIVQGVARPEADEHLTGYIDLTYDEVKGAVLDLKFGTNENAFALLKYVIEAGKSG
jgi:8-oxo-dGTP pyrophosphatase MutT (NUDIX family)